MAPLLSPVSAAGSMSARRLLDEFDLVCEAQGLSDKTREVYGDAARQLIAYLENVEAMADPDPDLVTAEHLAAFLTYRRRNVSPASARSRYNGLRPWFRWLARRGYVVVDPFTQGLLRPKAPRPVMPIPTVDAVEALVDSLAGRLYLDVRDKALTSASLGECSMMQDMRPG